MGEVIPFRRASGSWGDDLRIHNPDTCTKVARRIACEACGYPQSEARFATEAEYRAFISQPPTCHDDVTFEWFENRDAAELHTIDSDNDPNGSKES